MPRAAALLLLALAAASLAHAKVYERCELAKKLQSLGSPKDQIRTWVCIAWAESRYNTAAVGRLNDNKSEDHGIFQINDKYWCKDPARPSSNGCNTPCSKFQDGNIDDDWKCVNKVYAETKRLKGNGFKAWTTYDKYCAGGKDAKYTDGCGV